MRRVRLFSEAYRPRPREQGGHLVRQDGVKVLVWEATYRLLTPLFGGGVQPRLSDPVTVVRATEVRGQLRFWWRAVRGWQAGGDLNKLRSLEATLFGSAGEKGASPLALEVEVLDRGREAYPFKDVTGKSFPQPVRDVAHPYLAFPLQRTRQDPRNYPVRVGVRFRLRLRFPEKVVGAERQEMSLKEELEAAIWAWETFGGIGGRARRGFGALKREGASSPSAEEIREALRRFSRDSGWPVGVPHLEPGSVVHVLSLSWTELAEKYRRFRQMRDGVGRGPGRSLWPEPDAIRGIVRRHAPGHEPAHPVSKFPRGQFGLPIIFHFKDRGDPRDTTLKPRDAERRASPLIFRPLEEGLCLVAVLEGPRVPGQGVVLDWRGAGKPVPVDVCLRSSEAGHIVPLKGQTDPVRAFVDFLMKGGGA